MTSLGIELISVFAMPPVDFVNLAADLGCQGISLVLEPVPFNPEGYPTWSLRTDKALRRELVSAMGDRGVSIFLGEGFLITPETNAKDYAADLDVMCELGAKRINVISFDPDLGRTFDQFAIMAEMAAAAGMPIVSEFAPCFTVPDLPTVLAARRHVGRPDFRIVLDTMHLIRSGGSAADITALGPDVIGYVQLCDVPLVAKNPDYLEEATYERVAPGDGELPLFDILKALPPHLEISVETPMRAKAEAGILPATRLRPVVAAAQSLLSQVRSPAM